MKFAIDFTIFLVVFVLAACSSPAGSLPTEIPAPAKFAVAVPSATMTPTITPSITPTSTQTRTATSTAVRKPTTPPTASLLPSSTPKPSATPVMIPDEKYGTLAVIGNRAPHASPEVNLFVRGYISVTAQLGLIDIDDPADPAAPQLYRLFVDNRIPTFSAAYQLYRWDETCNCRGAVLSDYTVSLIGVNASADEILRVPASGYNLGEGYAVMVLYADAERIVLNYTRDGDAVRGYSLYLENVWVDANLVALYQRLNNAGRGELPALRAGQGFARVRGDEFKLAIRDAGAFMDPRSRKDWWRR